MEDKIKAAMAKASALVEGIYEWGKEDSENRATFGFALIKNENEKTGHDFTSTATGSVSDISQGVLGVMEDNGYIAKAIATAVALYHERRLNGEPTKKGK